LSDIISLSFIAFVGCQHALSKLNVSGRVPFVSFACAVNTPEPSAVKAGKPGADQSALAFHTGFLSQHFVQFAIYCRGLTHPLALSRREER